MRPVVDAVKGGLGGHFVGTLHVALKRGGNPFCLTFCNHLHWCLFWSTLIRVNPAGGDGTLEEFVSFLKNRSECVDQNTKGLISLTVYSLLHLTSDGQTTPSHPNPDSEQQHLHMLFSSISKRDLYRLQKYK